MSNKKLFRKNYLLFISMFIFICFCYILSNSLKVNAYHLDENTGNIVSDNLIDCPSSSTVVDSWQGQLICYVAVENNTEYSISMSFEKVGGSGNGGLALFLSRETPNSILSNWFPNEIEGYDRIYVEENKNANSNRTFNSGEYNYVAIYNGKTSDSSQGVINDIEIMLNNGSSILPYEPFGKIYFYGQQSYDNAYQSGYEDGYNDGLIAGNTASSFYFDSVKSLIDLTNPINGNLVPTYVDMSQYVTGYNSIINISEVLGHTYGSGFKSQYYILMLRLVNPIALNDVLKFTFSDISSIDGFSSRTAISFSSSASCYDPGTGGSLCPVYASFTYNELLQNNFTITLEDFGALEDVSSIDMVNINLYYNGSHSFGLLTLEDTTLIGNINTDFELGYRVGFVTGEQSGIIKGETIGYEDGYNDGYKKASQVVSKPGNNTLVGMVGTLIETPVNMFIDIFDFEFLGVNLVAFFFSLLTLIIVVWLIKYLK